MLTAKSSSIPISIPNFNSRFRKPDLSLQSGLRATDGQRACYFLHIPVFWDIHCLLLDDDRPNRQKDVILLLFRDVHGWNDRRSFSQNVLFGVLGIMCLFVCGSFMHFQNIQKYEINPKKVKYYLILPGIVYI